MTFLLAFFIALVPPDALTIGLFMAKKKSLPGVRGGGAGFDDFASFANLTGLA
jgi:hypothetical protein